MKPESKTPDASCPVVAWERKWSADGEVPAKVKGKWPFKFKFLDITKVRVFPDDAPLIYQSEHLAKVAADLPFLEEMLERFDKGQAGDVTQSDMVRQMISDWIDELQARNERNKS